MLYEHVLDKLFFKKYVKTWLAATNEMNTDLKIILNFSAYLVEYLKKIKFWNLYLLNVKIYYYNLFSSLFIFAIRSNDVTDPK